MIVATKKTQIGVQKADKSYTFLHWQDRSLSSKYKWLSYSRKLETEFFGVGPTMLVEWDE